MNLEKIFLIMIISNLRENTKMEKFGMEKEKNFVLNRNFLKENIIMVKDGMEYIKYIMIKIN